MSKVVHLKDGKHICVSALEIEAVPLASSIDADSAKALHKNQSLYAELLNAIAQDAWQQDTATELLYIAEPVSGQTYAARLRMFLVFRKYGGSIPTMETRLKALRERCAASLRSASYLLSHDDSCKACLEATAFIRGDVMLSIEKQARTSMIPGQPGMLCYSDCLGSDDLSGLSRVTEALSCAPGTALSMQLIPAVPTQAERGFVQGVCYYLGAPLLPGHAAASQTDAAEYYRRMSEALEKPLYLFNLVIMGASEAAMTVAARLQNILRQEGESVSMALVNRAGQLPGYAQSFAMYPWNLIAYKSGNPLRPEITPTHFRRLLHMISSVEAVTFFRTPVDDGSITGIVINRVRTTRETFAQGVIGEDGIQLGRLMGAGGQDIALNAPLKSFTRHALVVGMPGTGKTTFSVNLLLQLYRRGIPFLAIEPTKSEYRAMIDAIPELQVFTPGKNTVVPFIINPFLPPRGISLETFKPSLVSAFKAAFSMPSPLDILFANALDAAYVKHGWRGYSRLGDEGAQPFGLHEFVMTFREIIRGSGYSAESKGNMESAGVFRLLNLVIQNGNIYDTESSVPLEDLLRKPTVIELNAIDNQEQKALIMALLLINIVLYTKHSQAGDGVLKNILLIDEAHVLLDNGVMAQEGAAEAGASTVKALQNMIVEIRSYGTGIIIADQSPQKVTREIVGNTDVKVMFQLVQAEDKHVIAASSNMSAEDEDQLSRLNTGEAYVYFRGLTEPVRIMTDDIRAKEEIRLVVTDDELKARMHYWDDKAELLKPYSQCRICDVCLQCDFALRDDARFYVEQLFLRDKPLIKDKQALFVRLLGLEKRLAALTVNCEHESFRRLLYCVCVRYIRKAALETPAILSQTETERVVRRVIGEESDAEV